MRISSGTVSGALETAKLVFCIILDFAPVSSGHGLYYWATALGDALGTYGW
ncbi:MAG: hypothetical protein NTZ90_07620 [Proteobacteria bacterium]|nr:hypothetical protein [Pseudomonadota bacterium]